MAGCGRVRRVAAATALGGAVLLAAGCGGNKPATAAPASAPTASLAARYLAIAKAGNRGLDHSLDPLDHRDKSRLGPARANLRDAAGVEHTFDRRLLQIPFPPETEQVARTLYRVNQARASLTLAASHARTVGELHAYERQLDDANKPVEAAVRTIRRRLGLPPPPSS